MHEHSCRSPKNAEMLVDNMATMFHLMCTDGVEHSCFFFILQRDDVWNPAFFLLYPGKLVRFKLCGRALLFDSNACLFICLSWMWTTTTTTTAKTVREKNTHLAIFIRIFTTKFKLCTNEIRRKWNVVIGKLFGFARTRTCDSICFDSYAKLFFSPQTPRQSRSLKIEFVTFFSSFLLRRTTNATHLTNQMCIYHEQREI